VPKNFIEEITRKTDITALVSEYVQLQTVGTQLKGNCPFCKSPAFTVSAGKQIYKCFQCQRGGGVIAFAQDITRKNFLASVTFLAARLGLSVPENDR